MLFSFSNLLGGVLIDVPATGGPIVPAMDDKYDECGEFRW
jgi:hypothetical protein